MTFDPEFPDDWKQPISPKSSPSDSFRDLFNSDAVEFEPIDDDDDGIPQAETTAGRPETPTPDPAPASDHSESERQPVTNLEKNPPYVRDEEAISRGRDERRPERDVPAKPPKPRNPPPAETKPTASHWDLLASQLGLTDSGSDSPQPTPPENLSSASHDDRPTAFGLANDPTTSASSDSPLRDLFIPSGETFEEPTPRMVDDVSVEISEDFIEFEVEDLTPGVARRSDRREGRPKRPRPERKETSGSDREKTAAPESIRSERRESAPSAAAPNAGDAGKSTERTRRDDRPLRPAKEVREHQQRSATGPATATSSADSTKAKAKPQSPAYDRDVDDEDDFVEIKDDQGSDKNITTWRQAISLIVENNIKNHESSKGNPGRGRKPRKDGKRN